MRIRHALAVLLCCIASVAGATDLVPLRAQLELADDRIDYATAKLVVDRLIDPSTDAAVVHRALDAWESAVRGNVPEGATSLQTLDALLKTLYEPGPWNQGNPFSYDLSDPLGRNPGSKQLATYLATRKGNCVTMPILVVILGQRLGLQVALATAPHHLLAKFADDETRSWLNIEATAGGFKYDSSYMRETGITPLAMQNGLYLRPLRPREGVAAMAIALMEHFGKRKDGDALMAVADLALSVNPRDPTSMIWKANAFNLQLQARYVSRYPTPADIPPERLPDYLRLSRENFAWFEKAEALGWVEPTPEQQANYLKSIEREKARRGL